MRDLSASDFRVYDQGQPKEIVYFGRDSEPLSLLLLLDVSGSTTKHLEQIGAVARESLRFLRLRDRVGIMLFARDARLKLPWTDSLGTVAAELKKPLADETLGSGTSINDALLEAAKYVEETTGDKGRQAVLIITDNLGLNYKSPDEAVIAALNDADAVGNAIVVGKGRRPEPISGGTYRNPDFTSPDVFKISEETGGEAVKAEQAGKAFSSMIERIRTRYSLHFNATEDGRGFRTIKVELSPEARQRYPRAQLRHRKGYRVR